MKKMWVLYDERANYNVDEALVLSTAFSRREAWRDKKDMFPNAVIFEYEDREGELVNGKRITLLPNDL